MPPPERILASLRGEYRTLAKIAIAAGWTLSQSHGGHPKITSPTGQSMPLPSTSKNGGLLMRIKADMRRAGLEVPR